MWWMPTLKMLTTTIRKRLRKPRLFFSHDTKPGGNTGLFCYRDVAAQVSSNRKLHRSWLSPMADASIHDSTNARPDAGFGTHALAPWREALRSFGARLIPRRYRLLGSIVNWPIWRLSLVGRPGPVDLEPYPGFRLRLYPRENHADTKCYARPALVEHGEEAAIARCAATSPDHHFIMVDVGANTGTYSVLAASLARQTGKTGRFVCIEANPKTQRRLAANLLLMA